MILPRVPLYSYTPGPRPFSSMNLSYDERHLLSLMSGIRQWTSAAKLTAPSFFTYVLEQDAQGKYALNRYPLSPPYSTLEHGGVMPLVWTADRYGISNLQSVNHHGQASGNPFPPNILETHGKNYGGNIIQDCQNELTTALARLRLSIDWWVQEFKELTWEPNWFATALWTAPGEPKYNLTTDHVEALRVWPRALANVVVAGKPYQVDARRDDPGDGAPILSPRIPVLDGGKPVQNTGLVAVLADAMVYSSSLHVIPGGLASTSKGNIVDACRSSATTLVLHADGTITRLLNNVEQDNQPVMQWSDGGVKTPALSSPKAIEFHSKRDLKYMDTSSSDPLDAALIIVDGQDLCFATVELTPLRIVLRARISGAGNLNGVCLEHPTGFAKEGRPWAWRVLGTTASDIRAVECFWNMIAEGDLDAGAGTFQPLSVFRREGKKAMDVFPLPEMYFKIQMPDLTGKKIALYRVARNKLHILLAEQFTSSTNGAVEGRGRNLWAWTLDLPDGSNLEAFTGVYGGLYSAPTFDLPGSGTMNQITFPENKTWKLSDGNGPAADRSYTFHQWTVSNLQEDGGSAKWAIQALYFDDNPPYIDVLDIYFDGDHQTTLPKKGGDAYSTGKVSGGWLVNSAPGNFFPSGWSLQDMLDRPLQGVRNDPILTLWHVQSGDYVTGWSSNARRWQTHKLEDLSDGSSDKKTFSGTDWWVTSTLEHMESGLSIYGILE